MCSKNRFPVEPTGWIMRKTYSFQQMEVIAKNKEHRTNGKALGATEWTVDWLRKTRQEEEPKGHVYSRSIWVRFWSVLLMQMRSRKTLLRARQSATIKSTPAAPKGTPHTENSYLLGNHCGSMWQFLGRPVFTVVFCSPLLSLSFFFLAFFLSSFLLLSFLPSFLPSFLASFFLSCCVLSFLRILVEVFHPL